LDELHLGTVVKCKRRQENIKELVLNVPVVYMAQDIMILTWALSITRAIAPFEGLGPEIETFSGPEIATSEASAIWARKIQDFR
jgi:hypothetical protein